MSVQPSITQGREIPPFINQSIDRWRRQSATLQYTYMLLGVVAIVAPLCVATFTDLLGAGWTRALSFAGAGAAALTTGFRLQQKGNEMRKAYFELVALSLAYRTGTSMTEERLVEEFRKLAIGVASLAGPEDRSEKPPVA
jgi:hypothetical protein